MSSRPIRTRSSVNAVTPPTSAAPATRTRKPSSLSVEPAQTTAASASRPTTPAGRATRGTWGSSGVTGTSTPAAGKTISAPRPLPRGRQASEGPATTIRAAARPSSAQGSRASINRQSVTASAATPVRSSLASKVVDKRSSVAPVGLGVIGEDGLAKVEFKKRGVDGYDPTREPIQAYLRIRPPPSGASASSNYIEVQNDTEVLMVPPASHRLNPSSSTIFGSTYHLPAPPLPSSSDDSPPPSPAPFGALYKFTRVFSPSSPPTVNDSQSSFFRDTTLPLVHDFLKGENCLLFAYGPTGSGKTWTVQGGEGEDAGLLPRVMDIVWRSLEGKCSAQNAKMRQPGPSTSTPKNGKALHSPGLGLGQGSSLSPENLPEVVKVEEGYNYSIFVSYAEIYNEKIYDLLEAPLPTPSISTSSTASHGVFSSGFGLKGMFRSFSTVKRNALSLKPDKATGNKQVAGMREIQVHSAQEAQSALDKGQQNRRVFSTLSNRQSSRSHSVFTIKVVRTVKGADPEDPSSSFTSRFSIVDLAGSERVVNTQTTGDRLKEAGNINKSLMVLGQCMEVLRKNQERGRERKPAIVPFRHSKLTELFQSFFVGDGKAVMIVNVNPYETGFDENSHVMKFSAVAKGVMTVKDNKPIPLPTVTNPPPKEPRVVRLSIIDGGEEEDVIYEEEDEEDPDDDQDEFVNALLEELSTMRVALYESELRAVMVESQTRSKIVREYEAKLTEMEQTYQQRLREEAIEAENKMNAKLDILTRLQAQNAQADAYDDSDDEDESEAEEDGEEDNRSFLSPAATELSQMTSRPSEGELSTFSIDSPLPARRAAPHELSPNALSDASYGNAPSMTVVASKPKESDTFQTLRQPAQQSVRSTMTPKETTKSKQSRVSTSRSKSRGSADTVDLDIENIAFDTSIIIPVSGIAKKPSRKLGSQQVKGPETESIAEEFGPILAKTAPRRSIGSLNRR